MKRLSRDENQDLALLSEGPEVQVLLWVPKKHEKRSIFVLFSLKMFILYFSSILPFEN